MADRIVNALASFLLSGLTAAVLENLLFARLLGGDRLGRLEQENDNWTFVYLQSLCSVLSALLFWPFSRYVLGKLPLPSFISMPEYYLRASLWPLAMVICTAVAFFAVFVAVVKLAPFAKIVGATKLLPSAAFNNFVCGIMLIGVVKSYGFVEMIAFSLGSCVGYAAATFLMLEGKRKLKSRDMPAAFRGLPAMLLYLAGLCLAIYSLTGHTPASLL